MRQLDNDPCIITIGLPVLNGERYLEQSIASVLDQDYDDFELIIGDNASTDRTREICLSFDDKRIRYYRHRNYIEINDTFQFIVQKAIGECIMFASDDDLWSSNYVSRLSDVFRNNEDCVLAYPRVLTINEEGIVTRKYPQLSRFSNIPDTVGRLITMLMAHERDGKANMLLGLIRTDLLRDVNMYRDNEWGTDYLILFEIALHGTLICDDEAVIYKRQTKDNLGRYAGRDKKELTSKYLQCYIGIIENSSLEHVDKQKLLKTLQLKVVL